MGFRARFVFSKANRKEKKIRIGQALLCRCNDFRFNRWLDTTSIHGIAHVFHGRSPCRRLFWAIIFFIAFCICFYVVVNRFVLFFSYPTSTTTTFEDQGDEIEFPSVTFCNLNPVRKSFVDLHNLSKILDLVFHPHKLEFILDRDKNFSRTCTSALSHLTQDSRLLELSKVIYDQDNAGSFIVQCSFGSDVESQDYYNCTGQFTQEPTSLGLCYTFNSHLMKGEIKKVQNSGEKNGLRVILNIHQDEYITSLNGNAGVKLSINRYGDIPDLDENGILVPPGTNAYVGLKTTRLIDKTRGRKCQEGNPNLKYFESEPYSVGVCKANKFAEEISSVCDCLHYRTKSNPDLLRNCSINDVCCLSETRLKHNSRCPQACDTIAYTAQASYAQFPSDVFAEELSAILNLSTTDTYRDIVAVNVYFEEIGVTKTETINTYEPSDFLSDLGGTLGLFMGASVISLLELAMLVFDEIRDRTWKKSWKRKMSMIERDVFDGHIPEVTGVKPDDEDERDETVQIEELNPDDKDVLTKA